MLEITLLFCVWKRTPVSMYLDEYLCLLLLHLWCHTCSVVRRTLLLACVLEISQEDVSI